MEKIIPEDDGRVVVIVMTTGMQMLAELPPRSDTLERFASMAGSESFLIRRPVGLRIQQKSATEVSIGLVPLTPIESKDSKAPMPLLRDQVLFMYEPKEDKLRKDYNRFFSGLDIVSTLGPVGAALKM